MAQAVSEVLVSRDTIPYIAPYASSVALPANTVVWGTTWGGTWVNAGYTTGGFQFTSNVERAEIFVDQVMWAIARPAVSGRAELATTLAQLTPANILTATGQGSTSTTAAGGGLRGYTDWIQTSTISNARYAFGVDVLHNYDGEAFRIVVWNGQPIGSPSFSLLPTALAGIPLNLSAIPDDANSGRLITIRDLTPVAA